MGAYLLLQGYAGKNRANYATEVEKDKISMNTNQNQNL
jgi:hypothetical protein